MKVLVATEMLPIRQTSKQSKAARRASVGLPSACIAGELVWMIDPCPASRRNPNGPCDCARTFTGMSSDGRTPTAIVTDIAGLSRDDYIEAMRASFDAKGWCPCCTARPLDVVIDELIRFGAAIPTGTLVGRCVDSLILLTEPEGWG